MIPSLVLLEYFRRNLEKKQNAKAPRQNVQKLRLSFLGPPCFQQDLTNAVLGKPCTILRCNFASPKKRCFFWWVAETQLNMIRTQTLCSQKIAPIHTRYSWFFTRYSRCRAELQKFLPRLQSDVKLHCSAPSCATLSSGWIPAGFKKVIGKCWQDCQICSCQTYHPFHLS